MNYQQRIITEPASNFRALARQGLQGRWGDAFVKGALYTLMLSLPMTFILYMNGYYGVPGDSQSGFAASYAAFLGGNITYASFMDIAYGYFRLMALYELLVSGALLLGITQVYLRYRRGQEASTDLVFSGFSNFGRAFSLYFLQLLFICLWSLLLVIPGIIALYRYSLSFYILAENPKISPLEALSISKNIMRGNKWKLFCLQLSFLGWALLVGIAGGIVASIVAVVSYAGGASTLADVLITDIVTGFLVGPLVVYMGTSVAAFYERASGLLKYHDEVGGMYEPTQ